MLVQVSKGPEWTDPAFGWVTTVKTKTVSVWYITDLGQGYYTSCLHRTDPRCTTHPKRFIDDEMAAVWDYAPAEKSRLAMVEQFNALEHVTQELTARILQLESGPPPVKRGPGRPRKIPDGQVTSTPCEANVA